MKDILEILIIFFVGIICGYIFATLKMVSDLLKRIKEEIDKLLKK